METIEGKLSLDSHLWKALRSFEGDSSDIPTLIRKLATEINAPKCEVLAELHDRIYHQYSCCEATYAVLPHLVEIGRDRMVHLQPELWILIGLIASTYDTILEPVPQDLVPAFLHSIAVAEPYCIKTLLAGSWDIETTYYLAVSCFGLASHPLGKLVMDSFVPHMDAESEAICPSCNSCVRVSAFDTGLVVQRDNDSSYPHPPPSGRVPIPPVASGFTSRIPNPWTDVGKQLDFLIQRTDASDIALPHLTAAAKASAAGITFDTSTGIAFSVFGSLMQLKNISPQFLRYYYANDTIQCPACATLFVFADHWWGHKQCGPV